MSLWSRISNAVRGDRLNREIEEELQSHIAEAIEQGRDPQEARRALGRNYQQRQQREIGYEIRTVIWLESLRADILFSWRQLKRNKVTSAVAVLSLGLAMGACLGTFQLIDALFLRPMPAVSDPMSLYAVTYARQATAYMAASFDTNSYPFFEHARDLVKDEAEMAAASTTWRIEVRYGTHVETEKARRQSVSGELFPMLGLKPALGRLLTEDDNRSVSGNPYAVISYDYWQRRFGRDAKVIGQTFRMQDNVFQIVGVGPKGFTGTEPGTVTDIFVPAKMEPDLLSMDTYAMRVFVRVHPGVTAKALADKLDAAYQQWENVRLKNFPKNLRSPNATLQLKPAASGVSHMQSDYALSLKVLGVLVALVLLIACTNVANLMAGQAAARSHELAVRTSLGAGRARLVRLVMVESAMLGAMAAALGLAFANWATPYVASRINPPDDPARLVLGVDWMVAGFAVLLTLVVTMLFGLAPALRASAVRPVSALKGGEEPRRQAAWTQSMIAVQVAFCFVVLFLGGLFVATEAKLAQRPMGFEAERLLLLDTVTSTKEPAVKWDQMAAALRNVPGVQQTAMEDWPLLSGYQHNDQISVHGEPPGPTIAFFLAVSPGWLDTMRIPLVSGRDFRDTDATPSVAMVNETFAKTYFDEQNPVGQGFDVTGWKEPKKHYEIVGLVKDVMYRSVREQTLPQVYLPVHRLSTAAGAAVGTLQPMDGEVIAVRTSRDDVAQMAEVLRHAMTKMDPEFRVSTVTAQTELISNQTIRERLLAMLAAFFSGVALLLAAIGLYGVLSYSVQQREREFGIRIAVGAQVGNIAWLATSRVFVMVAVGAGIGGALGMASARYVQALLYGVKGNDPATLVVPMLMLLVSALLAALPAVVRAARIDPAIMLRAQ